MPEPRSPIELQGISLSQLSKLIEERRRPPVETWDPPFCGHSEMRIARDGSWYHRGEPIHRPELIRLFSSILRRDPDGRHMLVTPVEKLEIDVENTAFRAVDMNSEGDGTERQIAIAIDNADAVGSSRVDLQACKLEYSIVSPK